MKKILFWSILLIIPVALTGCFLKSPQASNKATNTTANTNSVMIEEKDNNVSIMAESGLYVVNKEASTVEWNGRKIIGHAHEGTVEISEGSITVGDDGVILGEFIIDMPTIFSTDEFGGERLDGHLKSADFFDVEAYPTATLMITTAEELSGSSENTHTMTGDLTIKDKTNTISFPANVTITDSSISAVAEFSIDRSLRDVRYGSDKFFDNLGDNIIDDMMGFKIDIVAEKK